MRAAPPSAVGRRRLQTCGHSRVCGTRPTRSAGCWARRRGAHPLRGTRGARLHEIARDCTRLPEIPLAWDPRCAISPYLPISLHISTRSPHISTPHRPHTRPHRVPPPCRPRAHNSPEWTAAQRGRPAPLRRARLPALPSPAALLTAFISASCYRLPGSHTWCFCSTTSSIASSRCSSARGCRICPCRPQHRPRPCGGGGRLRWTRAALARTARCSG